MKREQKEDREQNLVAQLGKIGFVIAVISSINLLRK